MKKKIINGILMVALLAATSTSFVSCKDNSEDVRTDLIASLNKQATDLTAAYQAADAALNSTIQAELATKADKATFEAFKALVENDYATKAGVTAEIADSLKKYATKEYVDAETKKIWDALNDPDNPSSVVNKIASINEALSDQAEDIADIQEDINNVNDELTELKSQINSIIETLENLVTSVTVNATANSIISNSKLFPGINMQFVGAAYGEPDVKKGTFPSDFVDEDLVNISEGKEYSWTEDDFINSNGDEFNAGKIYFTLNPSNITPNKVKLSLVNSLQTEYFKIGEATESKDELNWGLTRGVKDATYDAVVYEAPITYDATSLKAIELKNIVDLKAIAKNVKNIVNEAKGAANEINRSNYEDVTKATGKAVLKEAAQAVANLVNGKLPYMPAVALKATWSDTVGTRSVLSDYSIAATAYKPMSFKEFDGVDFSGYAISFNKLDKAVAKIVKKLQKELKKINKEITNIDVKKIEVKGDFSAEFTFYYELKTKTDAVTGTSLQFINSLMIVGKNETGPANVKEPNADGTKDDGWYLLDNIDIDYNDDIAELVKSIKKGFNVAPLINDASSLIKRVNNAAEKAKNLEARVTNYLEYLIQKVLNNANRALEPILLVEGEDGIHRASATYEAGEYTFVPTSVTYELVAPAFQKYIAVCGADGKARWGKVMAKGQAGFNGVDVDLKAGDTKIVYSALDFKGNTVTKVYNITVK